MTHIHKLHIRYGLLIGVACHLVLIAKALPYLALPMGSVVYADRAYCDLYPWIVGSALLLGLPLTLRDSIRFRVRTRNVQWSVLALLLCLSTPVLPYRLQEIIGQARHLSTPCEICDGPSDTMPGLYLVY